MINDDQALLIKKAIESLHEAVSHLHNHCVKVDGPSDELDLCRKEIDKITKEVFKR